MKKGIDLSEWQSGVDYNAVIESGIEFAIIRVGYGVSYDPSQRDSEFDNHYNGFKGRIPLGAYYFAYATDYDSGKKEAENCLAYMGDKNFELPIFYDMEKDRNTYDAARGFIDRIREAGLKAGFYTFTSMYVDKGLEGIDCDCLWLAEFGANNGEVPSVPPRFDYDIWQYTSKGYVPGVDGNADLNLMKDDTPTPTPQPTPPSPTPTPSYNKDVLDYQQSWNKTYGGKYTSPNGKTYLEEDGIFGPETEWSTHKVYLAEGMNNHLVGWCQCRLKYHKGYDLGTSGVQHDGVDDDFGAKTREVVEQFQRDNGLGVDGIIGHDTISLLF